MYQYLEACLDGERKEGVISLLLESVVAVAVPSLAFVTPLMVTL